ncbi:hypothetical protein FTUN_0250 [Frigoriglobus tundricola]|uniref:Uncharacterized protein n=1 Tax=Frigoriglobus tundricola TaxID=2774151 RepID=A0A6M5YHL5_9BACT|nr:hypothetical protein FTUN_0250 [Frigoriglobus tundricola]
MSGRRPFARSQPGHRPWYMGKVGTPGKKRDVRTIIIEN